MKFERIPEHQTVDPDEPRLPWLRPVIEYVNLKSSEAGEGVFSPGEGITSSVS